MPGKYGPHGELFFFLIQKEPATEQAMGAMVRCTSSGCMGPVTRSVFSCRIGSLAKGGTKLMALDVLCQEMHEAWWRLWLPDEALC